MMLPPFIVALGSLAVLASASPLLQSRQVTCVEGLYILVARGSNQPTGEGSPAAVADLVEAGVAGSTSVAIDYPAIIISEDILGSNYFVSVVKGIEDTKKKIEAYVGACGASSRIALIGYSQGGQVMTDTLAGGTLKPARLAEEYRNNIVGVAVFGDPRHNAGQPYSRGTSTKNGIFARDSSLDELNSWSSKLVSYCDADDLFCASGASLDVHRATVTKYANEAANFIIGLAT